MSEHVKQPAAIEVDVLRREICARIGEGMRAGADGFQFRFILRNEHAVEVWTYLYQDHQWHKNDALVFPANWAAELLDEFEMLAKRTYADDWSSRRVEHSDRIDFELKFRREAVESHLSNDIESFVAGCLFHGHHDTGKDSRRRINFRQP